MYCYHGGMLQYFAGPICEGVVCEVTFFTAYVLHVGRYIIPAILVVVGIILLVIARRRASKRLKTGGIVLMVVGGAVLLCLVGGEIMNRVLYVRQQRQTAQAITYDVYTFGELPSLIQDSKQSVHTWDIVKPETRDGDMQVLRGPQYTSLMFVYGKQGGPIAYVREFNKQLISPNDGSCGAYDPEFPNQKTDVECSDVGQSNFGTSVYRAKTTLGSGTVYLTDVGNTRIALEETGFESSGSEITAGEALKLFQSLRKTEPSDLPFTN